MEYSNDENRRWWDNLTKTDQLDILATMVEKTGKQDSSFTDSFAVSLTKQYERGQFFSPRQLAAIRKWQPR